MGMSVWNFKYILSGECEVEGKEKGYVSAKVECTVKCSGRVQW